MADMVNVTLVISIVFSSTIKFYKMKKLKEREYSWFSYFFQDFVSNKIFYFVTFK